MVNASHVNRKLITLLLDGSITDKAEWNRHNRLVYRLKQFKKRNPEKFNPLTNQIIADLTESEKTVDSLNIINKNKVLNHGKNYNRRRSLVLQKSTIK
jgi:hypothetical protein